VDIIPVIRVKSCEKCCFNLCAFSEQYQCEAPEGPKEPFEPPIGVRHPDCPVDKYGEIRVLPDNS